MQMDGRMHALKHAGRHTHTLSELIFQMARLLIKESNPAKLLKNPYINIEVIVRTVSDGCRPHIHRTNVI